jgi:hypothetical protein
MEGRARGPTAIDMHSLDDGTHEINDWSIKYCKQMLKNKTSEALKHFLVVI